MERFTQRARRVLSLAQEEAEQMEHAAIGTEHLLLGMMREESGVAGRVLRQMDAETDKLREMVIRLSDAPSSTSPTALELSVGLLPITTTLFC